MAIYIDGKLASRDQLANFITGLNSSQFQSFQSLQSYASSNNYNLQFNSADNISTGFSDVPRTGLNFSVTNQSNQTIIPSASSFNSLPDPGRITVDNTGKMSYGVNRDPDISQNTFYGANRTSDGYSNFVGNPQNPASSPLSVGFGSADQVVDSNTVLTNNFTGTSSVPFNSAPGGATELQSPAFRNATSSGNFSNASSTTRAPLSAPAPAPVSNASTLGQPTTLNPYGSGATATQNFGTSNYSGAAYDNSARVAREQQGFQAFPFGYTDGASRLNTSRAVTNNITTSSNPGPAGSVTGGLGPGGGGGNIASQLNAPQTSAGGINTINIDGTPTAAVNIGGQNIPLPGGQITAPNVPRANLSAAGTFATPKDTSGISGSPGTFSPASTSPQGQKLYYERLPPYNAQVAPPGTSGKMQDRLPGTEPPPPPAADAPPAAATSADLNDMDRLGDGGVAASSQEPATREINGEQAAEGEQPPTEGEGEQPPADEPKPEDNNNKANNEDKKDQKPKKRKGGGCSGGTPAGAIPAGNYAAQGLGAAAPAGVQGAMAAMAGAGMPAAIQSAIGGLAGGGGLAAIQGLMSGGFGGLLGNAIPQLGSLLGAAGPLGQVLSGGLLQQATGILGNIMGGGGAFGALSQIIGGGGLNNLLGSVMNPAQLLGQFANPQAILGLVSKQIPGLSLLANGFNGNAAGQLLGPILNQAAGGIFGQAFGKLSNSPIPGLNNLTQVGLNQLLSLGNSKLPGLFGTTPANSIFGNDIITNIIGKVGGNAMRGTSLSSFSSALAIADGAAAQLNSIQSLRNDAQFLKFTPKAQQVAAENEQKISTDLAEISQLIGTEIFVPEQPAIIPLTGSLDETIERLIETEQVDMFGSAYSNINDMITQGFGSLSTRPVLLGLDFLDLGDLGDVEDLFNLVNACQVARQIVEKGNISRLAIIDALTFNNLTVKDLTNSDNKQLIQTEILDKITDPATVQDALISLNIKNGQVTKLGDLTNTEIMLPRSNIYNRFKNFEDMALTLALCGTGDFITSLGGLGEFLSQLETMEIGSPAYDVDDLGADTSGLDALLEGINPLNGEFFTVVDFLGSALGFAGFDAALYRISELQARVFGDPAAAELYSLLEIMNDLLGGLYTNDGTGEIIIPDIGTYTVLDDAIEAVRDRIEDEVDQIYLILADNLIDNFSDSTIVIADGSTVLESDLDDSTISNYFELGTVLKELEELYQYVIDFLEREKKLRKIAGIEFDEESLQIENFKTDGSTSAFPLKKVPADPESATVIVNRTIMLYGIDYVIETSGDSVLNETSLLVFTAPPETLITSIDGNNIVQIRYNVKGAIDIDDDPLGIANFLTTLEGYAVDTGPYSIANILDKMATPDQAGEMIKSVMRQARNADLAETVFGIECKGLNRVGFDDTEDNIFNYFDFIDAYGNDQNSLNESYVYQKTNFTSDQYYASRLSLLDSIDKTLIKQQICRNVITQYLFITEDNFVAMTEEMYLAYELDLKNPGISKRVKLYKEIDDSGYAVGTVDDILYLMGQIEGSLAQNPDYVVRQSTYDYLAESQLDLTRVVKVCQAQLISDLSGVFNIHPSDTLLYFKRPSVVRSIQDYYNNAFVPPYNPVNGTET